jgi:hypothetical protein
MTRLEEIDLEFVELYKIIDLKESVWDNSKPWEEYESYMKLEHKKMTELSRERRMIMSYKLEEMPTYGTVMSLDDFIINVNMGNFIDYDGSGNYVKDGQMTDIGIYPSDVKYKAIRKEFDTIIWFNR